MSSDRREQAEQRLLDVERENQRLQAAVSMETIRGDAYKASFDRNVEQRTQDNVEASEVVATLESQVEEQNQRLQDLQLVVDRQTADHGVLSSRADESEGRVAELTAELTVATTKRDEEESRRLRIEADLEAARASLAELQRDCSALREELDRSRGQTRQAVRDRDILQGTLDIVRGAVLPPTSIPVIPSVGGSTIYKPPLRRRALRMSAPPMGSGPAYTPLATTPTTPVSSAETSGGASTSHSGPVTSKRRAQVSSSERQRKVPKKAVSTLSASSKRPSSTPSQLACPSGGDDGSSSSDDSGHDSEGGRSSRSSDRASGGGSDQDDDDSEVGEEKRPAMQVIAPFFTPVMPPVGSLSSWGSIDVHPWDGDLLISLCFSTITVVELRTIFPPPLSSGWIHPVKPPRGTPVPSYNEALVTDVQVRRLYSKKPWLVLCQLPDAWTFASDDADFVSLIRVFSFHLKKWCQVYWECTHTFPLGEHPSAFLLELQEDRSTRKSRAKFNFDQTVLPAVIRLMRHGRCDIDVLLDPIFTPFPPTRHRTKWYPTDTVDTLADGSPDPDSLYRALQRVDRAEPWRLYFRNAPADHPARSLDRLKDKFVPVVE
ncbi:hypothetical protein PF011_g23039 [Phytophthora fragariae]|uniref:Uncharacterized protein n=1 Tax=Phytophthora fragariae TaxID=53985 RepID=A0A6A3IGZ3_9STRA|nr:hypothetical protein PF011_g23039 [Phytophthora fragariae]